MRDKGQSRRGHNTSGTSVTSHARLKPWNPMCVYVCVFVKRRRILVAYSLSGDSTSLACSERLVLPHSGDLVSGSKPFSCQEHPLISGLHLGLVWKTIGYFHSYQRLANYHSTQFTCCHTLKPREVLLSDYLHWALQIIRPAEESVERPVDILPFPVDNCIIWAASMLQWHGGQVSITHCLQSRPSYQTLLTRMADGGHVLCMCWGSTESAHSAHV